MLDRLGKIGLELMVVSGAVAFVIVAVTGVQL